MRDSLDRCKVKDITKRGRDPEEKVIKNHPDAFNMLNKIGGEY